MSPIACEMPTFPMRLPSCLRGRAHSQVFTKEALGRSVPAGSSLTNIVLEIGRAAKHFVLCTLGPSRCLPAYPAAPDSEHCLVPQCALTPLLKSRWTHKPSYTRLFCSHGFLCWSWFPLAGSCFHLWFNWGKWPLTRFLIVVSEEQINIYFI